MISISFLLGLGPSANTPDPAHEISTKGPYAFDGFGQTDRPHFIKVLDVLIYVYIYRTNIKREVALSVFY